MLPLDYGRLEQRIELVVTGRNAALVFFLLEDGLHDLSIEEVRVDAVAEIVEKARQDNALVFSLGEGRRARLERRLR